MKISDTKIILIYGNSPIKGKIQDGNPSVIEKDINGDCPHYFYISEFIKTHLQDDKNFKKLLKFDNANSIFYEIQKLGHVVFAENTSDLKNKSGLIYLSEELTNNQKKLLRFYKILFQKRIMIYLSSLV